MNRIYRKMCIMLLLLSPVLVFASGISTSLLEKANETQDNELIPVMVSIHESEDYQSMVDHIRNLPMPERRLEGRKILREYWKERYSKLLEYLNIQQNSGNVDSIKELWLGGGLSFRVKPSVLLELAAFDEIKFLFEEKPCVMISGIRPPTFEEMVADATLSPLETAWGVVQIGAPTVWSTYNGQDVVVGVLDTGVNYNHNDLENNMWINTGEIPGNDEDDDFNGYVDDVYGYNFADGEPDPLDDAYSYHGTHTSGTVAGDGTSGTNTGVAPGAKIMALKVLFYTGSGWPDDVVEALQYGVDNGAQVFNLSIGFEYGDYIGDPDDYTYLRDYFREVFEAVLTIGITSAVSAGNGNSDTGGHYDVPYDISIPADSPAPWEPDGDHTAVMAVANTNSSNGIAYSSSYGPTEWDDATFSDYPWSEGGDPGLVKPDVSAPGTSIKSCWGGSETGYTTYSGTSMSSPHLAGMIALLLDKNPTLTPEQIDSIIELTALDLGTTGKDNDYGSGLIRAVLAILNTPALSIPFIFHESHDVDPAGNQVFDVNEAINLVVTLENMGVDASNVTCILSESSPYVSLPDPAATFGDISSGSTGDNTSNPFVIRSAADTPVGHVCQLVMAIGAAGGYSNTDTLEVAVGIYPRDYMDHNVGNIVFTVNNFGGYGFFDPSVPTPAGSGFEYDGYNYLYGAGFFMGFDYDNVITHEHGQTSEWLPTSEIELSDPPEADQLITTSFIDPDTRIKVTQRSYAWSTEDFIVIKYDIKNYGESTVSNFYTGLYADWDIHYSSGSWYDQGTYSPSNEWAYMEDSDSPAEYPAFVGLAGLSDLVRGSMVENPVYVYPDAGGMGWDDTVKYNFMSGAFSDYTGTPSDDWSMIIVSGPFTLAPSAQERIGYAFVPGDTSFQFQSNATTARTRWTAVSVEENNIPKPEKVELFQCFPNPFNQATTISYYINEPGLVEFTVYDITGKTVKKLQEQHQVSGKQQIIFNADGLSSGVYFYRLNFRGDNITKSMLLIK